MKYIFVLMWLTASIVAPSFEQAVASGTIEMKEPVNAPGYQPKAGMVPDARTAIAIAVAVWNPVYGEAEIASEKPYFANLKDGQWTVAATLKKGWVGGVATAVISKVDGRVISIYHTK